MAKTIDQIQTLITEKYDSREIINEIADYLQANPPGGGGAASYLVYTALLTQNGTSAPTADVLENTLGGTPVFSRANVGVYYLTLADAFPIDKTTVSIAQNGQLSEILFTAWNAENGEPSSEIDFITFDTGTKADGLLYKTRIEIRVYP